MRIYLNKRLLRVILVCVLAIVFVLFFLKLISIWDNSRGVVHTEDIQTTASPHSTQITGPTINVREPTDEERENLDDGSLTREELIDNLVNDATKKENTSPSGKNNNETENTNSPEVPLQTEYERRIAEIIAQAYVLRDEYVGTLQGMYAQAEATLNDLTNKDASDKEVASVVSSYLSKATELELQCDAQIEAMASEMESLIRENNGDMSLLDTLIETYATEKTTKKAWYINQLESKGLISR